MAASMEASLFIMFNMHVRMCACMGHPIHPYQPTAPSNHPTHPKGGDPPKQLKQIKIFQFCLKIWNLCRLTHL